MKRPKSLAMMQMLIIQFFLGMALNLIGEPQSDWATWHKTLAFVLIAWHVLNAIGLVVVGYILRNESKNTDTANLASRGFWSLIAAFIGGILTVSVHGIAEWASFLMAAGFLFAFIFFGQLYMRQRATAKAGN